MNEPEIKYFEDEKVVITNTRAILKGKTFEMANITSVSIVEKDRRRARWIILILLGLAIILFFVVFSMSNPYISFVDDVSNAVMWFFWNFLCCSPGILLAIVGGVMVFREKTKYIVKICLADRRINSISSSDFVYIQKIVSAINQAIAERG